LKLVVFKESHYRLAPAGQLVLRDKMTRVNMDFMNDVCFEGSFKLDASLKEGKPRGLEVFGDWPTIYAGLSALPEEARKSWDAFDHFYSDGAFPFVRPLVLSRPGMKLLDVGGNTGKWAVSCAQSDPEMTVTILDHSAQLKQALEHARAAGVDARVSGIGLDLLDHTRPFPTGFDVVWMSQFLDCFGEDDIVSLLKRGKDALGPGGKLCILETYWDRQPNETARYCIHATSLYFACMANGQSRMYHSDDLRVCVDKAGLRIVREHQVGYHTLWAIEPLA
jgi:SAM-dependent methyltransferase